MRYVGGKGKIARPIVQTIRQHAPDARIVVEPFMGGGAVTEHLAREFDLVLASDRHPDVAALWSASVEGWDPPETISEADYLALRNAQPSALRALAAFGGSFGGKWFGGYARGGEMANGQPRDHQAESARAVARIGQALRAGQVYVRRSDYQDTPAIPGAVIYADPPYMGTQGYATGAFDSIEFWAWAELATEAGAHVFVSEYRAPSWWRCIWSAQKRQSVTMPAQGREIRTERLFTLEAS